jgi:hypothetical protein
MEATKTTHPLHIPTHPIGYSHPPACRPGNFRGKRTAAPPKLGGVQVLFSLFPPTLVARAAARVSHLRLPSLLISITPAKTFPSTCAYNSEFPRIFEAFLTLSATLTISQKPPSSQLTFHSAEEKFHDTEVDLDLFSDLDDDLDVPDDPDDEI